MFKGETDTSAAKLGLLFPRHCSFKKEKKMNMWCAWAEDTLKLWTVTEPPLFTFSFTLSLTKELVSEEDVWWICTSEPSPF